MQTLKRLRSSCAMVAAFGLLQAQAGLAQATGAIESMPPSSNLVSSLATRLQSQVTLSPQAKLALLQQKVKYVFVLFQENISYDQHFGTFPGAHGLFSKGSGSILGFNQKIVNTDGSVGVISPFLIPTTVTDVNGKTVQIYPADTASVDHSHAGIDNSIDADSSGNTSNDRYALNEEGLTTTSTGAIVSLKTGLPATSFPTLAQKQMGELVMGHLDCDTVPFLWQFADRFTLMDDFHQTIIGPSTPNAIAMIAGQSGETQWALHPGTGSNNTGDSTIVVSGGEPIVSDPPPYGGSNFDLTGTVLPYTENKAAAALNQTYATLPLSFMGKEIDKITAADPNPTADLLDIKTDIKEIAGRNMSQIEWGWYQEGFDLEPTDTNGIASNSSYVTHHNGPQYFGYLADNPKENKKLHGLNDFFVAVNNQTLPAKGGVFYVRGGYGNNDGLVPLDPNPAVRKAFMGNDDHPGYSDAQISEALIADELNAIANSPYWSESAIIITYDETDGLYDQSPLRIRSYDPEGAPLAGGPRIPAIVISPYANSHVVLHEYAEHSSVIKFINELFGLEPLADLPDELKGRKLGKSEFNQSNLGPADDFVPDISDLTDAFDNNRLVGKSAPLPASYAMINPAAITSLPHYAGKGCLTLGITPTDYKDGVLLDPPPSDFNPRPSTNPGIPTSGTWTP